MSKHNWDNSSHRSALNAGFTQPVENQQAGFTIVELMIATSVFSIILLLSLAGFLQIGHLFFKGVNITQTSNVLNQTATSLKNDILFDNGNLSLARQPAHIPPSPPPGQDRWYFCAGSNRYAFTLGKQLDRDQQNDEMHGSPPTNPLGWRNFALLKDKLTTTGCPNPFALGSNQFNPSTVTELLGDSMRLSDLQITPLPPPNDKLYTISIKIAYGDDEVLNDPGGADPTCKGNPAFSKYCFVSEIRTTVRRGLEP